MMINVLFIGFLSHLFLYVVEIGQIAFVVAVIVIVSAVIIKIIKNRKEKTRNAS